MTLTLTILLAVVAFICFLGGANVLIKGAMYFLPEGTPTQRVLDDLIRFLGGIYFSSGFLFVYAAWNISTVGVLPYFLGIIVAFSGLGRLYSSIKVGSAGRYFNFITVVEILLGLSIIILTWLI